MMGSAAEADDAVQEAWLKVTRADTSAVENLRAWLTTVVSRVCLDMLRSRASRREDSLAVAPEPTISARAVADRELAESVGVALMIVLDQLDPAERLAFVLHDLFAMPFEEIAPIVGRSTAAARQLASRARRRVQGASAPEVEISTQRRVVESFIAALRAGDIEGLVAVLDPDAQVRVDGGTAADVKDARAWATGAVAYKGAAQHMRPVLVDGRVALALAPGGTIQRVLVFSYVGTQIKDAEVITEPDALAELTISDLP
jgi:RNA polymerase sigma factor (sigma-70 family)